MKRAIVMVIDSMGNGAMPDCRDFGDVPECNTLKNVAHACGGLKVPNMQKMFYNEPDKIDNVTSKHKFLDSIAYFRDGQYTKASKLVNSLSKKDSKFNNYAAMISIYTLKERSIKRAASNYKQALKCAKAEKFNDALGFAQLAFGLVQDDVKIKILIEQINLELEMDN